MFHGCQVNHAPTKDNDETFYTPALQDKVCGSSLYSFHTQPVYVYLWPDNQYPHTNTKYLFSQPSLEYNLLLNFGKTL